MDESGVNILIGDFDNLPEREDTTILLGSAVRTDASVLQLNHSRLTQSRSIIALKLCQRLLSNFEKPNLADMIVYDLETIDNTPKSAEIIEIGAHRLSAIGSELESYYQLVKPTGRIPQSSTYIHGIDNKTVANEPDIETVLPQFLSFIQDRILIGHNIAEFDNLVLERDLGKYLKRGLANPYYDTLTTAQRLYPRESYNLEALASKFNIKHDKMHRAIEDVQVTRRVFDELIKEDLRRREVRSLPELLPLVGIGILAAQQNGQDFGTDQDTADGVRTFYQAAARCVQAYRPELDWLDADLQPAEIQSVQDFIKTLTQTQIEESPGRQGLGGATRTIHERCFTF